MALDKFKLKDSSIILLKDTSYGVAKRILTGYMMMALCMSGKEVRSYVV